MTPGVHAVSLEQGTLPTGELDMREPLALYPRAPLLTIDETTAHIVATPGHAEELSSWFSKEGVACSLECQVGMIDLVLLDFGDPSPAQERLIRRQFAAWRRQRGSQRM
jgi:hypothetical protein